MDAGTGTEDYLEMAAGTGWWTNVLADSAASVTATDVNQATLDVARARRGWPPSVEFAGADALELHTIRGDFDAAFAGFFWSHVRWRAGTSRAIRINGAR